MAKDYIFVSEFLRSLIDRYEVPEETRNFIQAKAQGYLVREGLMQLLKYPEGKTILEEEIKKLEASEMLPLCRPDRKYYPHFKYDIYRTILNSAMLRKLFRLIFNVL